MSDYLTYVRDYNKSQNFIVQIFKELVYSLRFLFSAILGLMLRIPHIAEGKKRPIVLVSGLFATPFTHRTLRQKLIALGYPVYCFRAGFQLRSVKKNGQHLEYFLVNNNLSDCYLIAFGLGGIIAMSLGYRGRDRIRKLLTLGSPFKGNWYHIFGFFIPSCLQTVPFSPYLQSLKTNYTNFLNAQSVFTKLDLSMLPFTSARLGRWDDVLLPQVGHYSLFLSSNAHACAIELIDSEENKDPLISPNYISPDDEEANSEKSRPANSKKKATIKRDQKKTDKKTKKKTKKAIKKKVKSKKKVVKKVTKKAVSKPRAKKKSKAKKVKR